MNGTNGGAGESVEARRAVIKQAIRDIRESLPIPPWATHTHTDLGLAVRPEADWQRMRVAVNLRLLRVDQSLKAAAGAVDTEVAFRLFDGVEDELRDLRVNALPELAEAIDAHDEAAKRQVELEELREGYRHSRRRWGRWAFVLGPIALQRCKALDGEIHWIDEQLQINR